MIYDPITRQEVEIVGRYPSPGFTLGTLHIARVKYGAYLTPVLEKQAGGFSPGEQRDVNIHHLIGDELNEIQVAFQNAPLIHG